MEPEIRDLLFVTLLAIMFIVLAVRYYLRKARQTGSDQMIALRNGLLLALALFVILITVYENIREKRVVDDPDPNWCEKNPQSCRTPPAFIR